MSSTTFGSTTATETALPSAPVKVISYKGAKQTGVAGFVLPNPIVAQVRDVYNNGVPGVTVNFSATGGALNPTSVVTDAKGLASTIFQLPTTVGTLYVTASSTGLTRMKFAETSVAGPAARVNSASGDNQTAMAGSQLPCGPDGPRDRQVRQPCSQRQRYF
jgi:adhesin/invasin